MAPRPSASADSESRPPRRTSGCIARSATRGSSRVRPKKASSASAIQRPAWFACTAQPPPMAASVAISAKVSAMPASIGSPARRNGRSARAKTKGSTGRMQGLRMVRTPPR
jgi:hypothetical protein